jgi:hypothetical protein
MIKGAFNNSFSVKLAATLIKGALKKHLAHVCSTNSNDSEILVKRLLGFVSLQLAI